MKQVVPLEVLNIRKSFGILEVLKGVSLTAQKGDIISILGSSGSGKSTFLRCINFLEHPTEGQIFINDCEVALRRNRDGQLEPRNVRELVLLRGRLAMVFQSFNLWRHLTVMENVTIAQIHVKRVARAEAEERARHFLDRVGMSTRLNFYPSQLSGGQKQRAAIARALAMDPEILLFDEPTSALDPEMVGDVLKVMRDLAEEGRTMLVVTHEMAFARDVSTRVMFMDKGLVDATAPPDEMFRNPADISARWAEFIARM